MDFQLDTRQEALYQQITELCRQHLPEDPDRHWTKDKEAALEDYPEGLYRAMAAAEVYEMTGNKVNGHVRETTDTLIIAEALAASSFTASLLYLTSASVALLLQFGCDAEQQERWLPDMVAGRARFTLALVEPDAGSDAGALQCTAEPTEGGYVLNGHKSYVMGAAHADHIAVVARAPNQANIREATSVFMVPADAPGLSIENLDLNAGRSVGCAEVRLKDVQVGKDQLLGAENESWGLVMLATGFSRMLVATASVGLARNVFEKAHDYALSREQFGRPIGRFQSIAHRLSDMATEIEAMRLLAYQAASMNDEGDLAEKQIAMAKVYCTEKLSEITLGAMKIMGGRACLREDSVSRKLNEAMVLQCFTGTNEVLRTFIKRCVDLEEG